MKYATTKSLIETANAIVKDLTKLSVVKKCYTVMTDEVAKIDDADASVDDSYIHVFRHDAVNSLNVLQLFIKRSKKQVYILANAKQFVDCDMSQFESVTIQSAHTTRLRYIVSYDDLSAVIDTLLKYDSTKLQQSTTTVTTVDTASSKAN